MKELRTLHIVSNKTLRQITHCKNLKQIFAYFFLIFNVFQFQNCVVQLNDLFQGMVPYIEVDKRFTYHKFDNHIFFSKQLLIY